MTPFTLHYFGNYNTKSYVSQSICSVQLHKNNGVCSGFIIPLFNRVVEVGSNLLIFMRITLQSPKLNYIM